MKLFQTNYLFFIGYYHKADAKMMNDDDDIFVACHKHCKRFWRERVA
jgi:hypothetical protein